MPSGIVDMAECVGTELVRKIIMDVLLDDYGTLREAREFQYLNTHFLEVRNNSLSNDFLEHRYESRNAIRIERYQHAFSPFQSGFATQRMG